MPVGISWLIELKLTGVVVVIFTGAPARLRATEKIAGNVRVSPSRVRVSPSHGNQGMVREKRARGNKL